MAWSRTITPIRVHFRDFALLSFSGQPILRPKKTSIKPASCRYRSKPITYFYSERGFCADSRLLQAKLEKSIDMKNWSKQIEKNTQNFVDTFGGLNIQQLNWKPNNQTWSIEQNIDHLIVINKTYFPVIDSIRNGDYKIPFFAKFGFIVSFFGKTVLKAVQPDRKKKMKTFPIWEPTKSALPIGILDRFKEHQSELKQMIKNSKDLIEKGTIISSPANKNIVYKLETAFEIMVTHEQRHFEQSKETYQLMKKEVNS